MKNKRILLFLSLLLVCFLTLCPFCKGIAEKKYDGFVYEVSKDGTYIKIKDYIGSSSEIVVPSEINGVPVKYVKGLDNLDFVVSITISEGVEYLDYQAFYHSSVRSITLPESIIDIAPGVFDECVYLSEVNIPSHIEDMPSFRHCLSLKSIVVPEGCTFLEQSRFVHCIRLENVILPETITEIQSYAFGACASLKKLHIPDSVKIIQDKAFHECQSLGKLYIPPSVTEIGKDAFEFCVNLTLQVEENSEAHKYAKQNKIPFEIVNGRPQE